MTEAELIRVDDALPQILWTRYFIENQSYHIIQNILFQDNKSAIIMERTGKTANSKQTKRIKIRYFFITNHVMQGEVNIAYCQTEKMWSDILTKPLQSAKFQEMRAQLMNCPIDYDEHSIEMVNTIMEEHKSVLILEGCVGRNTNQSDAAVMDRQTSNGPDDKKKCHIDNSWMTSMKFGDTNTSQLMMVTAENLVVHLM